MDVGALLSLPKDIATAVGDALGHSSLGTTAKGMQSVMEPFEAFFKKFTQSVTGILEPFAKLNDFATHFVNEFDPSLVKDLSSKFRDLNAVIGVALRPIVDVARDVVKSLSDHLLPVMRQLEPIVQDLANNVAGYLIGSFDDLGNLLSDMMPIFRSAAEILKSLLGTLSDVGVLFRVFRMAIQDVLANLLGLNGGGSGNGGVVEGVRNMMIRIRNAIQDMLLVIIKFTTQLLIATGQGAAVAAMLDGMRRKPADTENSTGIAVALNPMFKSVSELAKSVQLAMFVASDAGGTGKKVGIEESNRLLEGIEAAIKNAKDAEPPWLVKAIGKIADGVDLTATWVKLILEAIPSVKVIEGIPRIVGQVGGNMLIPPGIRALIPPGILPPGM